MGQRVQFSYCTEAQLQEYMKKHPVVKIKDVYLDKQEGRIIFVEEDDRG